MSVCGSVHMCACACVVVVVCFLLHDQVGCATQQPRGQRGADLDVVRLLVESEQENSVEVAMARMEEHLLENEVASVLDPVGGLGPIELLQSERCRTYDLTRLEDLRGRGSNNIDSSDRHDNLITRDDSWLTRVSGRVLSHAKEIRASGAYVTMEDLVNCVPRRQVPRFKPIPGKETFLCLKHSYFCGAEVSAEEFKNRKSPKRSHWPCRVMPASKAHVTPLSLRRCTVITMSVKYRFIYLTNFKAGSSTVGNVLYEAFGADVDSASKDGFHPSKVNLWPLEFAQKMDDRLWSCSLTIARGPSSEASPLRRNTKTGLLEFNPDDFFIFSLVRDPHERFFSGFGEADLQTCEWIEENRAILRDFQKSRTDEQQYTERVGRMLTMMEGGVFPNEHVQSQTTLLGATDSKGVQIPLDFVGRLETISTDLNHIVSTICDRAASRNVTPLPAQCFVPPKDAQDGRPRPPTKAQAKARGDPSYTRRICDLFAQDYECFGYPLPKECTH
eukprot:TRINITY_DN4717_c0_g1_i1.p1 TRINITY_DN4717_c0_g1~~TRINITY_DN4717_c0_g1_i1.p1  ORF type:complete len:502 (+),score=33.39 TRINITY_DN4717_c0_g1_i1:282-1787(+)